MKNLYLIGAGGHCKSCIDVIELSRQYRILGIFDRQENVGKKVGVYSVIGTDEDLVKYVDSNSEFLITIGQIQTAEVRMRIADQMEKLNAQFATVISPRAYIAKSASIKRGTIIMHDALVNAYATIGRHCIVNTRALIEHDAVIEDFCHISTGAILNGDVHVKSKSFLGSLAVTQEGLVVPEASVLSAGQFHRKSRG